METEAATILIVDDDEDIRDLLRDRLEFLSYRVLTAADGEEGLARMKVDNPDLVLLDIQMPRLDGFGVLREMDRAKLDVTVIVITANATVQRAVKAMQEGAFDFLVKPFQPQEVEQRISRALGKVRLERENRRLQEELAAAQQRLIQDLQRELQIAHDMQMALLPDMPPAVDGMALSGICIPAREVGGDYYSFLENMGQDGSKLGIVLADVSGKGMQAATVAMRFNEMLRYEARGKSSGQEILKGLDASLRGQIPPEMFVTCGAGVLDPAHGRLAFTSAANPEVYHYCHRERGVQPVGASGFPLGLPMVLNADTPFGCAEIRLGAGDAVVFTSDGVAEAQDADGGFYGEDRLSSLVLSCGRREMPAEGVRDEIVEDVMRFVGNAPQTDDMTCVVLKIE